VFLPFIYLVSPHILNGHLLSVSSLVYLLRPTQQPGRFALRLFLMAQFHFVATQAPLHRHQFVIKILVFCVYSLEKQSVRYLNLITAYALI